MTTAQTYSPLLARYEEKYDDRPRMELLGLLDLPFRTVLEIGCGGGATGQDDQATVSGNDVHRRRDRP